MLHSSVVNAASLPEDFLQKRTPPHLISGLFFLS